MDFRHDPQYDDADRMGIAVGQIRDLIRVAKELPAMGPDWHEGLYRVLREGLEPSDPGADAGQGPAGLDDAAHRFADHVDELGAEFAQKLVLQEQLAAHDLYGRLREAGYSEITVLHGGDSMWVDDAEGSGLDNPDVLPADEIFHRWTEDHGTGPAERLTHENGSTLDTSQDPYGLGLKALETRRDQFLQQAGLDNSYLQPGEYRKPDPSPEQLQAAQNPPTAGPGISGPGIG